MVKSEKKSLLSIRYDKIILSLPIFCIITLGLLAYSNTFKSPFLFDDTAHITENPYIRMENINSQTLSDAAFKSPLPERPVANISFALNYFFNRYNVLGYHLVNITIHLLSAIFMYLLLKITLTLPPLQGRFRYPQFLAFIAACLWLIHPIQTQAVTYIVQRMTSMASMFYIMSIYFYAKGRLSQQSSRRSWLFFLACILTGILSFGCKEISATLPFFILLYEWFFFADLKPGWIKKHLPLIVTTFAVIVLLSLLYFWAKPIRVMAAEHSRWGFTPVQRLLTEFRVVIYYISLLFYPNPARLSLEHDFSISTSLFNPLQTFVCIIIVFALLILSIFLAKKHRLFSFCILWFLGNLFIESSFVGIELIYEHRLYLPSMFIIFAFAAVLWRLLKPNVLKTSVFFIIAVLLFAATYTRNKAWTDELTLWKDCVAKSPNRPRANYNLATAYYDSKDYHDAIKYYNRTLQLDPNRYDAVAGLGFVYFNLNDYQRALDYAVTAAAHNPKETHAYYLEGMIYYKQNKLDEAVASLLKAIAIEPTLDKVYNDIAVIYNRQRQFDKAVYYWSMAIRLNPDYPEPLNNLAWIMATNPDKKFHNPAESMRLSLKANKLTDYKQPDILDTLSTAYAANNQFEQAIQTAQKAIDAAISKNNNAFADTIKNRLSFYKKSQPFIEQFQEKK